MSFIAENLSSVKQRIERAALRAGRRPQDITLIAVSKTKPAELIREAYNCGQRVFGENRVQELSEKAPALPGDIAWQLIGHLQTNKVRQVVGRVSLIHSLDSLRLAEELQKESEKRGLVTELLLEINIAGEESKFGFRPEEAIAAAEWIALLPALRLRGLMTVAPFTEDPEENRKYFRQMRQLAVDIKDKNIDNVSMDILSMGMTGDFEVAVEEGATMVRVGTGIFGERDYSAQS
ncbi:MAG: YggS family pyridoxal phosphate-dependent enzyme [Lachnospiraceae bacterium]|nr:YggS family pyridoxal phosphate-dependent enzyme [Lachnospiraceae bacterium]